MALTEMPAFPTPTTFEEYLVIPLEGGYDILNGVLVARPGESWRHQEIVGNVAVAFLTFEKAHEAGYALLLPLDVVIRRVPLQTRQPDVLFFTDKRMEDSGGTLSEAPLEVGPNVAVEVLYQHKNKETISEKLQDYPKSWRRGIMACLYGKRNRGSFAVIRSEPPNRRRARFKRRAGGYFRIGKKGPGKIMRLTIGAKTQKRIYAVAAALMAAGFALWTRLDSGAEENSPLAEAVDNGRNRNGRRFVAKRSRPERFGDAARH